MSNHLNSLWKGNLALLEPLWEQVFAIYGDSATVLPLVGLGDDGRPNATTFTTRRRTSTGLEATFTWQATDAGPSNWTNGNDLTSPDRWQGIVPFLDFDGVNDEADSPDAAFWSTTLDAFSWLAWINLRDATSSTIMAKYTESGNLREWRFHTTSGDDLQMIISDENAAGNETIDTLTDVALTENNWIHVVATYDGSATVGSGTPGTGLVLYVDGVAVAVTAVDDASFVSGRDTNSLVTLGVGNGSNFFNGRMAGGPLGPAVVQAVLTPEAVKRVYNIGRGERGIS